MRSRRMAAARNASNNIRGMVTEWGGVRMNRQGGPRVERRCQAVPLLKIRQHIRKITFYDVFGFVAMFLSALFNSLSSRSLIFNLIIGLLTLLKILIGIAFYNKSTLTALRTYLIARYLYNIFFICPAFVLLRYFTNAHLPNYFYTGGILCLIEVLIAAFYSPHLFKRQPIENIEDIQGFKIVNHLNNPFSETDNSRFISSTKHSNKVKIVVNMNVREASRYIVKEIGEEQCSTILQEMQERYNQAKKRHIKQRGEFIKDNVNGYMCDFEVLSDEDGEYCHAEVKRPAIEFESEIIREEIGQIQNAKNKSNNAQNQYRKLKALEPQVNKVAINEVDMVPYKPTLFIETHSQENIDEVKAIQQLPRNKLQIFRQFSSPKDRQINRMMQSESSVWIPSPEAGKRHSMFSVHLQEESRIGFNYSAILPNENAARQPTINFGVSNTGGDLSQFENPFIIQEEPEMEDVKQTPSLLGTAKYRERIVRGAINEENESNRVESSPRRHDSQVSFTIKDDKKMNEIKPTQIIKQNMTQLQQATKAIKEEQAKNILIINENFQKPPPPAHMDKIKKQLRFEQEERGPAVVQGIVGVKRNNYLKKGKDEDDSSSVASNYTDQGNIVIGGKKKKRAITIKDESSSSLSD